MSTVRPQAGVIVVGSGAAGLSAALALHARGRRVTLITKGRMGDGSTAWAQGGLAAVVDPGDRTADHAADTLAAGAGLCDPTAVATLVADAPAAIVALDRLGARFDRDADGALALGLEGGHHARRIVHAGGDASGAEVARTLAAAVREAMSDGGAALELHEDTLAVDALLTGAGTVAGLRVLDPAGELHDLAADAVVLASGGIGRAWPLTTNPATATGDGLALAARAGATLADVEFVQFHPTVLALPSPDGRGALVSEALRGEGARLIDVHGEPVMATAHPLGDLAPRDVVAAAIERRMRATGADHVRLDATGFTAATWAQHFPTVLALCLERGIDPRRAPVPVAPAAHYACGGVLADLDGVTSLPGLFAVGEVAATGVHGANRLASNSLTEAVIAGTRVARTVAADPGGAVTAAGDLRPAAEPTRLDPALRPDIRTATGRGSGVRRDGDGLRAQLAALDVMEADGRGPRAADGTLREQLETANLLAVSRAVASAALAREESRGAHRRADFPQRRPELARRSLLPAVALVA